MNGLSVTLNKGIEDGVEYVGEESIISDDGNTVAESCVELLNTS